MCRQLDKTRLIVILVLILLFLLPLPQLLIEEGMIVILLSSLASVAFNKRKIKDEYLKYYITYLRLKLVAVVFILFYYSRFVVFQTNYTGILSLFLGFREPNLILNFIGLICECLGCYFLVTSQVINLRQIDSKFRLESMIRSYREVELQRVNGTISLEQCSEKKRYIKERVALNTNLSSITKSLKHLVISFCILVSLVIGFGVLVSVICRNMELLSAFNLYTSLMVFLGLFLFIYVILATIEFDGSNIFENEYCCMRIEYSPDLIPLFSTDGLFNENVYIIREKFPDFPIPTNINFVMRKRSKLNTVHIIWGRKTCKKHFDEDYTDTQKISCMFSEILNIYMSKLAIDNVLF